jgi:hypothetical protein
MTQATSPHQQHNPMSNAPPVFVAIDHDDHHAKQVGRTAVTFERIEVAPFSVERFGTTFGLVPLEPEEEDDEWSVEVQPGNYMAFLEPWDSGEYDT